MAMSDYEPASGFNLPPGCFEGDPHAPWNEQDPWVGRKCGECVRCVPCLLASGRSVKVCICDCGCVEEVDPERPAEECFE